MVHLAGEQLNLILEIFSIINSSILRSTNILSRFSLLTVCFEEMQLLLLKFSSSLISLVCFSAINLNASGVFAGNRLIS